MSALLDILAGAMILTGASIVGLAGIGLMRLPDPFMRMHAATKAGVVGSGLVLVGVALSFGSVGAFLTGALGLLFLLGTSPIASHALGRAAYTSGAPVAPATIADALAGVLPRNVFDISPGRVTRRRDAAGWSSVPLSATGGHAMSAIELRDHQAPSGRAAAMRLRAVTCWLVGGEAQGEASAVALDLASGAGARLTGLSAFDAGAADHRGAAPIGGHAWAKWLGDQRRTRMRERAAKSIAEFESLCTHATVTATTRHEERDFAALVAVAAGADLLVVPAGVDRIGEPARFGDEVAAELSAARLAPVLRVRRKPLRVRRVALIVSSGPSCGGLAHALLRSGLWRDATFMVIPVGAHRPRVAALAEEQAALLEEHGLKVQRAEPIELDADLATIEDRLRTVDAAVMGGLTNRQGWFGAVREDVHEEASLQVPLVLLP
jgi:monovalent cation/proton antiporter MnhG/PhaG subunit